MNATAIRLKFQGDGDNSTALLQKESVFGTPLQIQANSPAFMEWKMSGSAQPRRTARR
jgi:hypothetical protein